MKNFLKQWWWLFAMVVVAVTLSTAFMVSTESRSVDELVARQAMAEKWVQENGLKVKVVCHEDYWTCDVIPAEYPPYKINCKYRTGCALQ